MSIKSTVFSAPCCHIYESYAGAVAGYDVNKPVLCIEVSYGDLQDDCDNDPVNFIQVDANSDFAKLVKERFS